VDHVPEIAVLQLPKFKAEATDLIGSDGIETLAEYLANHPNAGDVIPEAAGARKLRWAAKGKGKRGGARVIYVYVVIAARLYLLRCYAKNAKTDLTAGRKERTAANRRLPEGSALVCQRRHPRKRQVSEPT
jgi:hypothetical protein